MIELNKIHLMDCLDGMKLMDDNSVDLIVTDPPYFIENLKVDMKDQTIRGSSKNNIFHNEFDHFKDLDAFKEFMFSVLKEFDRVLRPKGQVYMFISYHHLDWFLSYLKANFRFYKPIIWYKPDTMGVFPNQYGCNYEVVLWFRTTKKSDKHKFVNHIGCGQRDVFTFNSTNINYRTECGFHPTPKPLPLITQFILNGSNEGDIILDAFMGSGTTAVACKNHNRNFVGFEMNPDYLKICETRLAQKNIKSEDWFK